MKFIETIQRRDNDYVAHRFWNFVKSNSTYGAMFTFANIKNLSELKLITFLYMETNETNIGL